jgi:hypothetical protein
VDYVVFGIGFGATLVLLGWALRTFGPGLRYRAPEDGEAVLSGAALLGKLSWTRFVSALGAVVATGGTAMLIGTIVTILLAPRDRVGTIVVLSCFFLILFAACVWAWLYIGRYGTHGILPERTEIAAPLRTPREAETASRRPREDAVAAETVLVGPRVIDADQRVASEPVSEPAAVMGPSLVDAQTEDGEDAAVDDLVADSAEPTAAEKDAAIAEPETRVAAVDEQQADAETEPVETSNVVVADDSTEAPSDVDGSREPVSGDEDEPASEAESSGDDMVKDEQAQFVDVLPRTSTTPEESGRAEALRNLRARRSSRFSPDQT